MRHPHLPSIVIVTVNSRLSTAPTKAKSREPAYSQALIQNKVDRQRVRSRESGRQTAGQCRLSVWANWAVARGLTTLGGLKRNLEFKKEITWSLSTATIENS